MGVVWVGKDIGDGNRTYAVFSERPELDGNVFRRVGGQVRVDVCDLIGEELAGRSLSLGECIEVVVTEVCGQC